MDEPTQYLIMGAVALGLCVAAGIWLWIRANYQIEPKRTTGSVRQPDARQPALREWLREIRRPPALPSNRDKPVVSIDCDARGFVDAFSGPLIPMGMNAGQIETWQSPEQLRPFCGCGEQVRPCQNYCPRCGSPAPGIPSARYLRIDRPQRRSAEK